MNYNEKFWTKINKLKELENNFKKEKIQKEDIPKKIGEERFTNFAYIIMRF